MTTDLSVAESLAQNYLRSKDAFPSVWWSGDIEARWMDLGSSMSEGHRNAALTYLGFIIGAAHGCTSNADMVRSATHLADDVISKYVAPLHGGSHSQSNLNAAVVGLMRSFVLQNYPRLTELIPQFVQHFVTKWPKYVPYLNGMGVVRCSYAEPSDLIVNPTYIQRIDGSSFFDTSVVKDSSLHHPSSGPPMDLDYSELGNGESFRTQSVWDLLDYQGTVLQWVDTLVLPNYQSTTSFFPLWVQSQNSKSHSWLAQPLERGRQFIALSLEENGLVPLHGATDEDIQDVPYQSSLKEVQEECIFQIQAAVSHIHHHHGIKIDLPHEYKITKGSVIMGEFAEKKHVFACVSDEIDRLVAEASCTSNQKEVDKAKWCVALTCFMVMYLEIQVVQLSDAELRDLESQL